MKLKYNVISACCKGEVRGRCNQDYLKVAKSDSYLIASVADGLGSACSSSKGSKLVCKIMQNKFSAAVNLDAEKVSELLRDVINEWYSRLRSKGIQPIDCCTTLSSIIVEKKGNTVFMCQIGDSPIFYRTDGGLVSILSEEKDFLNETSCIGSEKKPSFTIREIHFKRSFDFLVASDGFGGDVVPEFSSELFDYFINKYGDISKCLRNRMLRRELIKNVSDRNNDDKSLIFGWICQ